MNREQRRLSNKPQGKLPRGFVIKQKHMNLTQIHAFMESLETFIQQIESDGIYVDQNGNALMDLPNERVEDLAQKGKEPRRAVDNIAAILEMYFQLTAYCFSDEDLERVSEEIGNFNRKIVKPLKLGSPIQRQSVDEAKQLCLNMRSAIAKAPAISVNKVAHEIKSVIERSNQRQDKYVCPVELRSWLMEWAKGDKLCC